MEIIQKLLNHKEELVNLAAWVISGATIMVNLMPEPTEKSNAVYKAIHNAVHFLSGNKQIQYYLDKAKAK